MSNRNQRIPRLFGVLGLTFAAAFIAVSAKQLASDSVAGTYLESDRDHVPMTPGVFQIKLEALLRKDDALKVNDYSLWPEIAALTREFARDRSILAANGIVDRVFAARPQKKLYSHIWAVIPGGVIENLSSYQHWSVDIYEKNTNYPEVRRNIQSILATEPSTPFSEFGYYVIGDFQRALGAGQRSLIAPVIRYAIAHKKLKALAEKSTRYVKTSKGQDCDCQGMDLVSYRQYFEDNAFEQAVGPRVPNFAIEAAEIRRDLRVVIQHRGSPHADDAAFWSGWLAYHAGLEEEALADLGLSISFDGDYSYRASKYVLWILKSKSNQELTRKVLADLNFRTSPLLRYYVTRRAYQAFDYRQTIEFGEAALRDLQIPTTMLPVTTDPKRITRALYPNGNHGDPNLIEIPYVIQASRELLEFQIYLKAGRFEDPAITTKKVRAVILKYSSLVDSSDQSQTTKRPALLAHKDFRQALHLIEMSLDSLPRDARYTPLREWLWYRKVRILTAQSSLEFQPQAVASTVGQMREEYPQSRLLDDVMAELVFIQGEHKDLNGAKQTLATLVSRYPNGNALDNAFSWMAISMCRNGRDQEYAALNREITQRFPSTRHARYARERLEGSRGCPSKYDFY